MPNYEYKCLKCQDVALISHPLNDTPSIICPECSTPRVKMFSAPLITFKGGGWGSSNA